MESSGTQSTSPTSATVRVPATPVAIPVTAAEKDLRKVLAGRLGGQKTAKQFAAGSDAAKERARRGGLATAARYGLDYFVFIGKKSVGKPRRRLKIKVELKPVVG